MSGFSDLVDLWVIKMKKPIILCARITSRSREQSTKHRSSCKNIRTFCLVYSHNNKIAWLPNIADKFWGEIHEVRKGMWAFLFLDCAFRMLIGWADQLRSHRDNGASNFPRIFVTSAAWAGRICSRFCETVGSLSKRAEDGNRQNN